MGRPQDVSATDGPDIHDVWRLAHDLEKYNEVECSILIKAAGTTKAPRLLWSVLIVRRENHQQGAVCIFADGTLSRYSMRYVFQAIHAALSQAWEELNPEDESTEAAIE